MATANTEGLLFVEVDRLAAIADQIPELRRRRGDVLNDIADAVFRLDAVDAEILDAEQAARMLEALADRFPELDEACEKFESVDADDVCAAA